MSIRSFLPAVTSRRRAVLGAVAAAALAVTAVAVGGVPSASAAYATVASSSSCTAPTPPSGPTKFGVSLSTRSVSLTSAISNAQSRLGTLPVVRVFLPTVPATNFWANQKSALSGKAVVISFRMSPSAVVAGTYDSQLKTFFSTAPTSTPIYWNYYHEPEKPIMDGKFTAAQYRVAFQHIAAIGSSYCKSNLYPTLILMGWTLASGSHRTWTDYYPGSSYISMLAWDPYNNANSRPTSYASASSMFQAVAATSKAAGKPWGIAETGSAFTASDHTGTGRAAWLTSIGKYLRSNDANFVTYFNSVNGNDFRLLDAPSIKAWKSVIANNG